MCDNDNKNMNNNIIECEYCTRMFKKETENNICNECIIAETELYIYNRSETCINCKKEYKECKCIEMPNWASCKICDVMIGRNKTGTMYCDDCVRYFLFIVLLCI